MLVAQSCPTLCKSMDCSPAASSVHGILQARILEWAAIPFSRGSAQPRDWTGVSCIAGRFFSVWATREANFISNQFTERLLESARCQVLCYVLEIRYKWPQEGQSQVGKIKKVSNDNPLWHMWWGVYTSVPTWRQKENATKRTWHLSWVWRDD